jgi:hypothetical protein
VLVGIAGWHAHSSQILPPPVASKIGEGFPIVWPFSESTSVMGPQLVPLSAVGCQHTVVSILRTRLSRAWLGEKHRFSSGNGAKTAQAFSHHVKSVAQFAHRLGRCSHCAVPPRMRSARSV